VSSLTLPPDYHRIKVVHSFDELAATPLANGVNALCWPRTLPGHFREVVERLDAPPGITTLEDSLLEGLPLSAAGKLAVAAMLEDLHRLRELGLEPVLDCINGYLPRSAEQAGAMRTDVCSWHVDSATAETDTWLCTYHGRSSEGLRNDEAIRRVDIPGTRAALLQSFGGNDDDTFLDYLHENFYNLHYAPVGEAQPFSFGAGNLWRIATEYPGSPVPPCIHRAPATVQGELPRLLLIS
jgi:hypothetical protein